MKRKLSGFTLHLTRVTRVYAAVACVGHERLIIAWILEGARQIESSKQFVSGDFPMALYHSPLPRKTLQTRQFSSRSSLSNRYWETAVIKENQDTLECFLFSRSSDHRTTYINRKYFSLSLAERRQVLGGEQPSTVASWRGRTSGTRHMDGKIRLPVVSSGLQRWPRKRLAFPVPVLLERRRCFSNTVYDNAYHRRTTLDVHGTISR